MAERRLIDAELPPEIRADTPEEFAYKEDRLRRSLNPRAPNRHRAASESGIWKRSSFREWSFWLSSTLSICSIAASQSASWCSLVRQIQAWPDRATVRPENISVRKQRPMLVAAISPLGVLGALQDHHTGALAHHEPVAVHVERAGGALRLVVAGAQGPGLGETGDRDGVDAGLRTTGHHHVGVSVLDHLGGLGQALGTGRARRSRRVHTRAGAQLQADHGGRPVGHQHRHGQR